MTSQEHMILNKQEIQHKIGRIAYEIYENNYLEKELYIAGIPSGYKFANLLVKQLKKISPFEITLLKIVVEPGGDGKDQTSVSTDPESLEGKVLILVDDVINTGRTLIQSLKPFIDVKLKKIETVALINRSHRSLPVSVNYSGYELATTLNDHIEVSLETGKFGVYLY